MIKQFFKEYAIWYIIYLILTGLYFLNFYLYHLPIRYFISSLLLNVTILILISIWKFWQFSRKINSLLHFIYINELDDLKTPSDLAYRDIIVSLKEAEAAQTLLEKTHLENLQAMIKMWFHQMKVPLSALSLMAQTDHLEKKEVEQQLMRLEKYLNTLLNFLKFHQQTDDFRFEEISARELMTQLVKKYSIPCRAKSLSVDISGDWILKTDKKWLFFALSQIFDNAVKYSKEGGMITVGIANKQITVSDNGIGILEEDLPRIFEDGFTGYNGHEHQKATGLGLYMAKQVLDKLDFTIELDSQIDQGTSVSIAKK